MACKSHRSACPAPESTGTKSSAWRRSHSGENRAPKMQSLSYPVRFRAEIHCNVRRFEIGVFSSGGGNRSVGAEGQTVCAIGISHRPRILTVQITAQGKYYLRLVIALLSVIPLPLALNKIIWVKSP